MSVSTLSGSLLRPQLLAPAVKCFCAAAKAPEFWATSIKLRKSKVLEVEFNTGECFSYPAEYLRVESPAAATQDDASGRLKVVHGRRHVGIMGVEPVGSYAVRLSFDDLHSSGIYTWPYLHLLGLQKLSRMRRYIQTLRERGLSRDPIVRTSASRHEKVKSSAQGSGTQPQQAGGNRTSNPGSR